jgi:hypothetical protein
MTTRNNETRSEILSHLHRFLVSLVGNNIDLREESQLYRDYGLRGDDVSEFFDEILDRYYCSFSDFHFAEYFPQEGELWLDFFRLLFFCKKKKYKPISIGDVVSKILTAQRTT